MTETAPGNGPLPPGMTPEQMAKKREELGLLNTESLGFGYQLEDDGVDLGTCAAIILEKTKKGKKEVEIGEIGENVENLDHALANEIDSMLSNFTDLYTPGDWELKSQLANLTRIRKKIERRIQVLEKDTPTQDTSLVVPENTAGQDNSSDVLEIEVAKTPLDVLKGIHEKLLWAEGVEKSIAGAMISTATYYAEEDHLANIPKIKVTSEDKQKAFSEKLPGIEKSKSTESLLNRSEMIKMQDDAMQITMMAAAVHQTEYENLSEENPLVPVKNPRERKEMVMTKAERELIVEVFATRCDKDKSDTQKKGDIDRTNWIDPKTGEIHQVPTEILQYFCMDKLSDDKKRLYFALMTSMISSKALERLRGGKEEAVDIAKEVRGRASQIVAEHFSPNKHFTLREIYANIATRTIIAGHLGDMSGGELGWGWKYEKTDWDKLEEWEKVMFAKSMETEIINDKVIENGAPVEKKREHKFVTLRISDLGSIYSVDDIPSPMFPERHVADYQANVESTAELMWGLSDKFRREVRYHRPDWSPNLNEYCATNPLLKSQVDALLNGTYEVKDSRKGVPFGRFDPRFKTYIEKNKRAWPTWVTVGGKEYAIPLFYPPVWYSLNIWRSVGDGGNKAAMAPSEWERMWEGRKLSKIDYGKYADHVSDWKNVNGAQLARVLVLLFLSHKFARVASGAYETYFTKIFDGKTFTDWEKRWRLGTRGEDVIAGVLGLLTFSAFSVKVSVAKEGIGGLANPSIDSSRKIALKEANAQSMATLELNAMNLPRTKGTSKEGLQNLRGALAAMTHFYGNVLTDWEIKAYAQTAKDHYNTKVPVKEDLEKIYKINSI